ncbi:centaurin-gamma-1A isoform X1 [Drosophila mauritiana]|uniref:Centaurin-gamma-1A isoform X1 n=2 Tax=Drosophila mauritiana TaxID=7226 RepID=A0A6P8JS45_DROMA|nr:centaurin-gamma-1A isoform X1 [Drosophila mauritiana]
MSNYHPHSHPHALSHPHPQQVHNQLQNPHQNQLPPPQRHNHVASTAAASASGAPSSSASASASILVAHPPQPLISNSLAIRQEIQRFESVHPSIYAIYELIDLLPMADAQIAQSIRDHVVCIEDSFVNSQEWTISRSVPDLRLGIVGSLNSGKSALVHRYLTGSYMQEESPEGGRFKKEVFIDGQSYLLLIRDEGGAPEMQFAGWVDAVIFVFSLENEGSFNTIYNYYTKMAHFRNGQEIPMILVGTQDAINERNPRVIDDTRARKLASDLKRCSYYETCATYGLNVERVFQDACQKILSQRLPLPPQVQPARPTTPQGNRLGLAPYQAPTNGQRGQQQLPLRMSADFAQAEQKLWSLQAASSATTNENNNITKYNPGAANSLQGDCSQVQLRDPRDLAPPPGKELPTPTSTPTTSRKSRRRSNLFIPSSSKKADKEKEPKSSELGSGRSIPIKQGYLYKRSSKSLNKEWKKKYVTLCDDGRLTYHPSLHDYMDDVHGKEIPLQYVTVKVPGQKPRGSKSIITNSALTSSLMANGQRAQNTISDGIGCLTLAKDNQRKLSEKLSLLGAGSIAAGAGGEPLKSNSSQQTSGDEGIAMSNSNSQTFIAGEVANAGNKLEAQTPNVKKRHRRMKSSSVKANEADDNDGYEFYIVSLDSKQWHFEAANSEERDEWVAAVEQEIFKSLQSIESSKTKQATSTDLAAMLAIRQRVPGNGFCVDCGAPNPEWASLNLGVLMCIECSGVHRNLGSHISKVRSLGLDDWPSPHLSVMLAIGNSLANSVWESNTRQRVKPTSQASREDKERWVRSKYEAKEFLTPLGNGSSAHPSPSPGQQLIEAVIRADIKSIVSILANCPSEVTNANVSARDVRTPLLLACAIGNLAIAQLLIWNGANIKHTDHEGRTCLAYARAAQSLATAKSIKAAAAAQAGTTIPAPAPPTNGGIPAPQYNVEDTTALVELLEGLGCPEAAPLTASGTLPRRRDTLGTPYEKSVSGVI